MKYQFTSRKPATAAASAGHSPPTAETPTTSSRKSSRTLGRPRCSRSAREHERERAAGPTAASRSRASTRRRGSAARPARARRPGSVGAAPSSRLITCTSMPCPSSRITVVDHRAARQLAPARPAARAEHDLRRVQRPRRVDERLADVGADDLAVACRRARSTSLRCRSSSAAEGAASPSCGTHVHGDEVAFARCGHARGAADEPLAVGRARERDDDPLARLPRLVDAVPLPVVVERLVDAVGDPEQRELAQRAEVAGAEVVAERGVDPLGRVDVAVRQPARGAPRGVMSTSSIWSARRTTSSGIVSRCLTPVIRSTTSLSDSRCWMLSVEITSIPASSSSSTSCQRFSLREPGTFVCASSSTSATCGPARRAPRRRPSPRTSRRGTRRACAARPRGRRPAPRSARGRASRRSRRRRPCRARRRRPSSSMAKVLPTPGAAPR